MKGLYRKKYIISIYDEYDRLITVLDNILDFAIYFRKKYDRSRYILAKLFTKKQKSFYYKNNQLFIYFIEY